MRVKVIGYSNTFSWSKNGRSGEGMRVYIIRSPFPYESGISGHVADAIFLSSDYFKLIPKGIFEVGSDYDFNYSSDGRRSFLSDISLVK